MAVLGLAGWRVFEHVDQHGTAQDAAKPCTTLDRPVGSPTVPAGFALPCGEKLLQGQSVGSTDGAFASLPGSRAGLVSIRDRVAAEPAGSGYTVTHRDQEPTFEADATIRKDGVDDTVSVGPLYSGKVVARYTLHQGPPAAPGGPLHQGARCTRQTAVAPQDRSPRAVRLLRAVAESASDRWVLDQRGRAAEVSPA